MCGIDRDSLALPGDDPRHLHIDDVVKVCKCGPPSLVGLWIILTKVQLMTVSGQLLVEGEEPAPVTLPRSTVIALEAATTPIF
jgi:hypothetical protein